MLVSKLLAFGTCAWSCWLHPLPVIKPLSVFLRKARQAVVIHVSQCDSPHTSILKIHFGQWINS